MIFDSETVRKFYINQLIDLPTSSVSCSHFKLGNPKIRFSTILFIRTSDYLRYLRIKGTVSMIVNLPITSKNVITLPCKMQNLFVWWKVYCFRPNVCGYDKASCVVWHWWLWKEPIMLCGNLNVRQASSQQVFKVTAVCMDTRFSLFRHWLIASSTYFAEIQPMFQQAAAATCAYRGLVLGIHASASCRRYSNQPALGQDCWLATCQDWWNEGVSCVSYDRDVLVHCLGGRQTRPQCCGSQAAGVASVTDTSRWYRPSNSK